MRVNNKVLLGLGLALIALVAVSFVYHFENTHKNWRFRSTYITWPQGGENGYRRVISVAPVDINVVDSSGQPKEMWGYFTTLEGIDSSVYYGFVTPTSTAVGRWSGIDMILGARNVGPDRVGVWYFKQSDMTVYYAEVSVDSSERDAAAVMSALSSAPATPVAQVPSTFENVATAAVYPVGDDLVLEFTTKSGYRYVYRYPGAAGGALSAPLAIVDGDRYVSVAFAGDKSYVVKFGPSGGHYYVYQGGELVESRSLPSLNDVYWAIPAIVLEDGNPVALYVAVERSGSAQLYRMDIGSGSWDWQYAGDLGYVALSETQYETYPEAGVTYVMVTYDPVSESDMQDHPEQRAMLVLSLAPDGWGRGDFSERSDDIASMETVAFYPVLHRGGIPAAWQTSVFESCCGQDAIHFAHVAVESPYSVYDVNSLTVPYWTSDNDVNLALHVRGAAIGAPEVTQYFVVSIWDENYYHNWRFFVPVTFPESNSLVDRTVYVVSKLTADNAYYAHEGKPVDPSVKYKISVYTVDNVPTAWEYENEYRTYYDTGWFYPADVAESREIPPQNEGGSGTGGGSGVVQVSHAPHHKEYFVQPASPVASPSVPPSFVVAVLVAVLVIGSLAAKAR